MTHSSRIARFTADHSGWLRLTVGLVVVAGLWALVLGMGWYEALACIQWPYLDMCG